MATGQSSQPAPVRSDSGSYERARAIVLRQLTMAPKSRAQLAEKLRRKDCPDDVASAVLDRMTEVGLIDDRAFAEMLVRSQQAGRGLARRALVHELRGKGIDDETAAQTLAGVDDDDERARAVAMVQRRLRSMNGVDSEARRRRLAGMLARKGYSGSMAYSVVRQVLGGDGVQLTAADGADGGAVVSSDTGDANDGG